MVTVLAKMVLQIKKTSKSVNFWEPKNGLKVAKKVVNNGSETPNLPRNAPIDLKFYMVLLHTHM